MGVGAGVGVGEGGGGGGRGGFPSPSYSPRATAGVTRQRHLLKGLTPSALASLKQLSSGNSKLFPQFHKPWERQLLSEMTVSELP